MSFNTGLACGFEIDQPALLSAPIEEAVFLS